MPELYPHEKPLSTQQEDYLKKIYYTDFNYFGRDKLFKLIENQTSVPRIYRAQVALWLKQQKNHQITLHPNKKQTNTRPIRATKSAILQMDLVDLSSIPDDDYKYILVVIDVFSRYAFVYPIESKSISEIKPIIENLIRQHPQFKVIQSDNGGEFKFEIPGIKHIYSTPHTPTTQGVVESFNKTIRSLLRRYFENTGLDNWSDVIEKLIENYNKSFHTSLKNTPFNVFNETDPEKIKDINQNQNDNFKKKYKNANDTLLNIGTKVRLLDAKRKKRTIVDKSTPFYSKILYVIVQVIKGNSITTFSRNRYKLKNISDNNLLPNTYNSTQFQIVSPNEV